LAPLIQLKQKQQLSARWLLASTPN
jgi:hypothetical protein